MWGSRVVRRGCRCGGNKAPHPVTPKLNNLFGHGREQAFFAHTRPPSTCTRTLFTSSTLLQTEKRTVQSLHFVHLSFTFPLIQQRRFCTGHREQRERERRWGLCERQKERREKNYPEYFRTGNRGESATLSFIYRLLARPLRLLGDALSLSYAYGMKQGEIASGRETLRRLAPNTSPRWLDESAFILRSSHAATWAVENYSAIQRFFFPASWGLWVRGRGRGCFFVVLSNTLNSFSFCSLSCLWKDSRTHSPTLSLLKKREEKKIERF